MRKIIKLTALAGVLLGMLVFAPNAQADEQVVPEGSCVVNGSVELAGLSSTPSNGHYEFQQTSLVCVSATEPRLNDTFAVEANGDTTGTPFTGGSGEDCEQGRSDGPGSIEATSTTTGDKYEGDVEFTRLGSLVHAWGHLEDSAGNDIYFSAEMQFTPAPGQTCATAPVTEASLIGVASVNTTGFA